MCRVVMAAWDLLAVLCATIAPTEVLMPHILNECLKARSNKNYRSLPKLAGVALKKTMVLKPRDVIPTNVELNAILVPSGLPLSIERRVCIHPCPPVQWKLSDDADQSRNHCTRIPTYDRRKVTFSET